VYLPTGVGVPDLFTTFLGRYIACLLKSRSTTFKHISGSALDNAMAESFFWTLKAEMCSPAFPTREAARRAIFDCIQDFYNPTRRHSSIGYMSPADYEPSPRR
jgi:transposase InsO family protein